MSVAEVVEFVNGYASASAAPVRTQTTVTSVRQTDDGYHVATDSGDLRCRSLVLASGACNVPSVPALREGVPPTIESVTPLSYRSPVQLPDGECWSSGLPLPACSWPRRSTARVDL